MTKYRTILVKGRLHVVKLQPRYGTMVVGKTTEDVPIANYLGVKHQVLCGVLKEGETLEQWITNKNYRLAQIERYNYKN